MSLPDFDGSMDPRWPAPALHEGTPEQEGEKKRRCNLPFDSLDDISAEDEDWLLDALCPVVGGAKREDRNRRPPFAKD
jgi:hypothetical protein